LNKLLYNETKYGAAFIISADNPPGPIALLLPCLNTATRTSDSDIGRSMSMSCVYAGSLVSSLFGRIGVSSKRGLT